MIERGFRRVVLSLVVGGAVLLSSCGSPSTLDDPAATGRELVTEFLTILGTDDTERLDDFLADGFQLLRANGSGATKAEYLANPAVVETFTIGEDLIAVQDGDVLTVRWSVALDESIAGTDYATNDAPRLSVFVRDGDDWRLIAHANFNLPQN